MTRVSVILSGCGVYDGTEIHEAVLTLLYLDREGAEVQCFAPDKPQIHVVDHLSGQPSERETRNVLVESARIARGKILPLSELNMDRFDAVVFPGGFGAAKNLCTFASQGDQCDIDPEASRVILEAVDKKKVIGAICISPALIARALQGTGLKPVVTIGTDAATAGAIRALGAENVPLSVKEIAVDEKSKIVSTPAYMLGTSIAQVSLGIEALIQKVVSLCK